MAKELTNETFAQEVEGSSLPVLVDFWAPWCGPCKMLGPIIEEVSNEVEGKALVFKVNVDEQGELAQRFGVSSIPTVVAFHGGKESGRQVGLTGKQNYIGLLKL